MRWFRASAFFCGAALLAGCEGNPQRLPVGVSGCGALSTPSETAIQATIQNKSYRPIAQLDLTAAFYQDFRYAHFAASAKLRRELDPGQTRAVEFDIADNGGARPRGEAIRCYVTHIGYLDGTSEDAPPDR